MLMMIMLLFTLLTPQVSIEMAYEILKIQSPSHGENIQVKKTATKATVQLENHVMDDKSQNFVLLIQVENPNEPRLVPSLFVSPSFLLFCLESFLRSLVPLFLPVTHFISVC